MIPLAVVTASTTPTQAATAVNSWALPPEIPLIVVANGAGPMDWSAWTALPVSVLLSRGACGPVAAFAAGVRAALDLGAAVIACLHDDLLLTPSDPPWWTVVTDHFQTHPQCGLAGFGGAIGLGDPDIYRVPYAPSQLARRGFRSNLVDAELHGVRSRLRCRVACLDGFSQIGRRAFFLGERADGATYPAPEPVWEALVARGIVHHAYDSVLGALAARLGWETWYLPQACLHLGGQTAVGDPTYQTWARTQHPDGDQGFWAHAHVVAYDWLRDVLPLTVTP